MTSPPLELHVSLWSGNRDFRRETSSNFQVDLKSRYSIRAAALSSAEFVMAQYNVEASWNTFLFDLGWSFSSDATVIMDSQTVAVSLPRPFLSCTRDTYLQTNRSKWIFDRPHGLFTAHLGLLPAAVQADTRLPVLQVLDATSLVTAFSGASTGLLVIGTGQALVPGPNELAAVLQASLSAATSLPIQCQISGGEEWTIFCSNARSLEVRCGDLGGCLPVRLPLNSLAVSQAHAFALSPGNYDLGFLRSSLELLLDPLTSWQQAFPEGSLGVQIDAALFRSRAISSVSVLAHPQGMADRLTLALQDSSPDFVFKFVYLQKAFVLILSSQQAVTCQVQLLGPLASVLGWSSDPKWLTLSPASGTYQAFFSGESINIPFAWAQIRVPMNAGGGFSLGSQRQLRITASQRPYPRPLDGLISAHTFQGQMNVLCTAQQPSYFIAAGCPVTTGSVWGIVQEVILDSQQPVLVFQSSTNLEGQIVTPVALPVMVPQNIFFPIPPSLQWSRLAEVLGFLPGWNHAATGTLGAPFTVCLDHPPFLLVELSLGHTSVNLIHWVRNDVRNNLFAKLPAFCPYRWERTGLLQKAGSSVIQHFQVRLLNPWLEEYHTHGQNWSATLLLILSDLPVQLM